MHPAVLSEWPVILCEMMGAFAKNVAKLWTISPTIIRNKPHFYKML